VARSSHPSRRLIPVVLAVAALLAAGLVALASRPGGAADAAALTAPALRLADRAGLVTVAMAAHAEGLQLALMAPEMEADPPVVRDVAVGRAGGPLASHGTEGCGDGCTRVPATLPRGDAIVRVRVDFAGRTDTARFRFPWPLPADASALLGRADERTRALSRVLVRERVTSDPRGGFFPNPDRVVTGDLLAGTFGVVGAQDPRELPAPGPVRRIAYAIPAAPMWIELWIAPDGTVRRDRVVGPKHLLQRTFAPR
jgi:hypothetical protein